MSRNEIKSLSRQLLTPDNNTVVLVHSLAVPVLLQWTSSACVIQNGGQFRGM